MDPHITDQKRIIRAPHGTNMSCKSWQAEAAMRMLMNNLDPEVAERPEDLVVYGGRGKAARNWKSYDAIIASLISLEPDETLLVQSGKPVGIATTTVDSPLSFDHTSLNHALLNRQRFLALPSVERDCCWR